MALPLIKSALRGLTVFEHAISDPVAFLGSVDKKICPATEGLLLSQV